MKIQSILVVLIILLSGAYYYQLTGNTILKEEHQVQRIIDGDTLELSTGQKVRLLGINTPEKKMPYSNESTKFLSDLVLNKSVSLEIYGTDKYGRFLAHLFYKNEHINKLILENGLASLYYYDHDKYFNNLRDAEKIAMQKELGIWKKSSKSNCLNLLELKYKEDPVRCSNDEKVIIQNLCNENIQFFIKDDATHIYYEITKPFQTLNLNFSCIWNDAGDSLYAFDQEGMVLFYRYSGDENAS